MTTISESPPPIPRKRPALVWVISIFYFVSAGWTILSLALIYSGVIPLKEAQKTYFDSQTLCDHGSTLVVVVTNLAAAVLLFLLKKPAFHLFATAFFIGLMLTVYQVIVKNWLGVIGGPGLVGAIIGWGINMAIIIYSRRLISRGVLK